MGDNWPSRRKGQLYDKSTVMTAGVGDPVTDSELVARFLRDPEMFTAVYDRYIRDVHHYVAGRLGMQAADDLAAETFLVAFGQRDRFDPSRGSLRPWLFGIATNLVARHRRQEARRYAALARTRAEPPSDGPENRVINAVSAERLKPRLALGLTQLSRGERDVILLVALSEFSHEEVSEALGISYGTVCSRLSRARKKLQKIVDQEEVSG